MRIQTRYGKRKVKFNTHLVRIHNNSSTKKLFNYITKVKAATKWIQKKRNGFWWKLESIQALID